VWRGIGVGRVGLPAPVKLILVSLETKLNLALGSFPHPDFRDGSLCFATDTCFFSEDEEETGRELGCSVRSLLSSCQADGRWRCKLMNS
jgi:hypothetical protein